MAVIVIEKIDITLAKNIKTIRKLKSISQGKLSEILGVSYQQIQKYETGKNRIPSAKVKMIADYFNIDINSLFTEDLRMIDIRIDNDIMNLAKDIKKILLSREASTEDSLKIILDEFFKKNRF
jgi:transcriptional regulator with XRE-family HTH domain